MPETPPASHGEAGAADETVQIHRRDATEAEQQETSSNKEEA